MNLRLQGDVKFHDKQNFIWNIETIEFTGLSCALGRQNGSDRYYTDYTAFRRCSIYTCTSIYAS